MKKSRGLLILLAAIVVILIIFLAVNYNSFVTKQENVQNKWANLQATYQRRADLVPSLAATVQGASDYEKGVLVEVTEARNKASQIVYSGNVTFQDYQQLEQAQGEMVNAANKLIAVAENYPNLKATENYRYLQTQLEGTERRIKFARAEFNASVADYNNKVRRFPSNLAAKMFGFGVREGFAAQEGSERAPEINFKK